GTMTGKARDATRSTLNRDLWRWLTPATAGLLGMAFAFIMPPFGFNDEHSHFARAYQISCGQIIGKGNAPVPSSVLCRLVHAIARSSRCLAGKQQYSQAEVHARIRPPAQQTPSTSGRLAAIVNACVGKSHLAQRHCEL